MKPPNNFIIRELKQTDFNDLDQKFGSSSVYKKPLDLWKHYLHEQETNNRVVKVVEVDKKAIGIGTLKFISDYPNFRLNGIPEINDVVIFSAYQNQGIGQALIASLELAAKSLKYKIIGLAVGLYKDYGKAQRLYVRMGYLPDGMGITYQNQPVVPGDTYPIDDDLLLWFTKKL